jgi:Family of unknown function (DUF5947)
MTDDSLAVLRRLTRPRDADERCDLCGSPIPSEHRHLFDTRARTLVCSCQACSLLFVSDTAARYVGVPDRVLYLAGFQMSDGQWDDLLVPVNLAFFTFNSQSGRVVGLYPSPAGATESQLGLHTWSDLVVANPILEGLKPDVEALLVNRVSSARDHYIVPIDQCYRLVGMVRAGWRGLSGGTEVWRSIAAFFADVKQRAKVVADA